MASITESDHQERHPSHQTSFHPIRVPHQSPNRVSVLDPRTCSPTDSSHEFIDRLESFSPPLHQVPRSGDSTIFLGVLMLICSCLLAILGIPWVLFDFEGPIRRLKASNELIDHHQDHHPIRYRLNQLLIQILSDQLYKFLIPLQLTLGSIFVIINWGGLKIFRHS